MHMSDVFSQFRGSPRDRELTPTAATAADAERQVAAAVAAGKIAPEGAKSWTAEFRKNPALVAASLAKLEPVLDPPRQPGQVDRVLASMGRRAV